LAKLLQDEPQQPIRRKASYGFLYTKHEFLNFYNDEGEDMWDLAEQTEEFEWGATSVDSMLGRALWPRESPKTIMVVDGEITTAAATCPTANVIT